MTRKHPDLLALETTIPGAAAWIVGADQGRPYHTEYVLREYLLESPKFS